jgi:peptidyl-prolyl cis-trans isomerase B (cyclophilin B)
LTLSLVADAAEVVIGEDVQLEATLTNAGDKVVELSELAFDDRSLSFDVTFDAAPGKPKQFLFSVTRPDPHLADRVLPPRVALRPKKALVGLFRVPALKPGDLKITGVYKGAGQVSSAPLVVKVKPQAGEQGRLAAVVDTTMGPFQIDLLPEEAPNNVANFVSLARRGFYNNLSFFRVIRGSWIQTGCPMDMGYFGPGYAVKSEAAEQKIAHELGTVSLSGHLKNGYHGSQFYITLARQPSLDGKFTVIGRVPESGQEVVRKIGNVDTDKNSDRPSKEDIRVKEVKIVAVK